MAARKTKKSSRSVKSKAVRAKATSNANYSNSSSPISLDAQSLITIIFLVVAYPIGVTLMFLWTRWPFWVKMVIAIPMTLFFIMVLLPILATLIILHKLSDNDSARYMDRQMPVVQTESTSPSVQMMLSPTPGAQMQYNK